MYSYVNANTIFTLRGRRLQCFMCADEPCTASQSFKSSPGGSLTTSFKLIAETEDKMPTPFKQRSRYVMTLVFLFDFVITE